MTGKYKEAPDHSYKALMELLPAPQAQALAGIRKGFPKYDTLVNPRPAALATARAIPVAQEIATRFNDLKLEHDIGPLKIKISGCINACGHHHVGHIGILGLDRAGVENYQITLGGDGSEDATIGEKTGPGFAYDQVVPAIERIVLAYLDLRQSPEETFLQAYRRVGVGPFKTALYEAGERDAA